MPIASMTALGSASSSVGQAVANIIDYLEGNQQQTHTLGPDGLVDYYADSTKIDSPGWWSGRGVGGVQLEGAVDPEVLARVLLGQHPHTGEQLVGSAGSAGRARANTVMTVRQVAEEFDLSESKITKLAAAGQQRSALLEAGEDISHIRHWLDGVKVGGHWRFPAAEIEREQAAGLGGEPRPVNHSDQLSVNQTADGMGITPRAVRKLAAAGQERAELIANGEDVGHIKQWLDGVKVGRSWTFDRAEVERAIAAREEPRVVVAIDFTASFEKSISLLWVNSEPEQRVIIENAIKAGVQAGVSHLEDHGLQVRSGRGAEQADGVWAASYLHLTNRSLEPQLHVHTVVANVAAAGESTQAIDARGLYREATTAGYLAGAQTRAILTEQLGVTWDRPHKGTMEVAGVSEAAIDAMSTRRAEVIALADELGYDSAKSRQIAALSTRARKQHPEDFDSLVESWRDLAARNGFGVEHANTMMTFVPRGPTLTSENAPVHAPVHAGLGQVYAPVHADSGPVHAGLESVYAPVHADSERVPTAVGARGLARLAVLPGAPGPIDGLDAEQSAALFAWLGSSQGLTRSSGVFGRSDIIEAVISWDMEYGGGNRLRAETIQDLADQVMGGAGIGRTFMDHVVAITVPGDVYARSGGVTWCTTESMLAIEREVIDAYANGRGTIVGLDPDLTTGAVIGWQTMTGKTLGIDQADMVHNITERTDQISIVVGPAGTGKTAALEVACRAWESSDLKPFGVAVTGSAADTLAASTGIETSTVASLLARHNNGFSTGIGPNSVLIVDEASLLSNRDHRALIQIVNESGARMVAIGDPAQHGAVEAGGLWSHLVASGGSGVSVLEVNRRQSAPEMAEVRLANDEIRRGEIGAAFKRLQTDERIVTAPTSDQLFDALAADWYVDLLMHRSGESRNPSAMMAENHSVRRELITRAQVLLLADGTLSGDGVKLGESTFHLGERVITRVQHDTHRFDDRTKLRNGTLGTVTGIHPLDDGRTELTVNFDGKGTVRLDHAFLTQKVGPGVTGGLVPEYARTTHTAQGQTMTAGRAVGTERSSREAIYVALTRGTSEARIYLVDRSTLTNEVPDVGLPALKDERSLLERLAASLQRKPISEVATELDPRAFAVAEASHRDLATLRAVASTDPVAAQALRVAADRVAIRALIDPPAVLVERAGPRPAATDPNRPVWDKGVTDIARYWAKHVDGPLGTMFDQHAVPAAPGDYVKARAAFAKAEAAYQHPRTGPTPKPAQTAPAKTRVDASPKRTPTPPTPPVPQIQPPQAARTLR
jgi:conjugative relaxase-like TrwC/TraI family protein